MEIKPEIKNDSFHDGPYRRGYHQGYYQAIEDIKSYDTDTVEGFLMEIMKWRNTDNLHDRVPPPEIEECFHVPTEAGK